jgi:hypothetical protein
MPGVATLVGEATGAMRAVQGTQSRPRSGVLGVSGVLAEQLARELGAGAEAGAVRVVGSPTPGIAAAVRVIAGEPSDEDEAFVSAGDRAGVPIVLVQLWPQADWTPPFVLSPFVVECRAGEGFPLSEIASRIAEALADAPVLAARIPVLRDTVASRAIRTSVVRAALLGLRGRSRPLITLEQLRLTAQLRSLDARATGGGPTPELAATAGAFVASGFALRAAARTLRRFLPDPLANAAVAAAGTWALAEALRRLDRSSGD